MLKLKWVLRVFVVVAVFSELSECQGDDVPGGMSVCNAADRAALLSFKAKIVKDTSGSLESWVGRDCCNGDWEGVECDPATGRVTALELQNPSDGEDVYMVGTLSPALGNLQFLQVLVITGMRHISGPIPETICNLRQLSQLVLEDNSLGGPIPSNIGRLSLLKTLLLDGNRLVGPLPPSLGNLRGLAQLNLASNYLVGPIPPTFQNLQCLEFLDLGHNLLSGVIPDFVGHFRNLTFIDVSNNRLSGPIPLSFCSLTSLSDISLSNNLLTGSIPNQISSLTSLTSLGLSNNRLTGPIPESLGTLHNLWYLNLSRNALTNPLPRTFTKGLPSLLSVDLSYNKFNLGTIPNWITSRQLSAVHLAGCNLRGALPNFTKPASLISVDFSHNHLTDGFPNLLTRMPNLQFLKLSNNLFKYDVSRFLLPKGISFVDLSSNQLFGPLSAILNDHTSSFLEVVDVSNNLISGIIPELRQGLSLKVLNLGNNKITGHIPSSISNLLELQIFDITRNQISGIIAPSLGQLVQLQWLDLSINSLRGPIPDTLLRIKNLRHASFRANRLCGMIPQGRPFNIFPAVAYAHNQCLCGKPLPPCKGKIPSQTGQ